MIRLLSSLVILIDILNVSCQKFVDFAHEDFLGLKSELYEKKIVTEKRALYTIKDVELMNILRNLTVRR